MTSVVRGCNDDEELRTAKATGDEEQWIQPPLGENGAPVLVDLRFNLYMLKDVDTVAGTAFVKLGTSCYWTDPRLAGWPDNKPLPASLWGPKLSMTNELALEESPGYTVLVDPASGRLRRGRTTCRSSSIGEYGLSAWTRCTRRGRGYS